MSILLLKTVLGENINFGETIVFGENVVFCKKMFLVKT